MTIKELAEFTGKNKSTIGRWIEKLDEAEMLNELRNATSSNPVDFTIDEVERILKAGSMSKDAVNILMANARQESPGIAMNNSVDYEIIGKMIGMAVVAAMTPVIKQLEKLSKPQMQIEAPKEDYFSLVAYCSLHSIKTNRSELAMHGRELRKMAIASNKELRKIPDERWGEVNSYPIEVLKEYFAV